MAHVRIWKFRPPEGQVQHFVEAYASDGSWARLFGRGPGFQGSVLLRPAEPDGWWLTIDKWGSRGDFDAFQRQFGEEYRRLDSQLEGIAGEEQFVGAFEEEQD